MNVYLAGKVDSKNGDWRNAILGMAYAYDPQRKENVAVRRWANVTPETHDWESVVTQWEPIANAVLGLHTYTGPFRQEFRPDLDWKHKARFHGVTTFGMHGTFIGEGVESLIVAEARDAIERSDIILAYINAPDAFGTLLEIGYAAALQKFIALVFHEDGMWSCDDYWFVDRFSSVRAKLIVNPGGKSCDFVEGVHYFTSVQECGVAKVGSECEGRILASALKDAFVAYSAHPATRAIVPVAQPDRTLAEAANSFCQIARWTSDPRVRGEAERMLRMLGLDPSRVTNRTR